MTDLALRTKNGTAPVQVEVEREEQAVFQEMTIPPSSPGVVVLAALLASLVLGLCCASVILLR